MLKIISLYLDQEDRLCVKGRDGQLVYVSFEAGKLVQTPGPDGELEVGQAPTRSLWDYLTNG